MRLKNPQCALCYKPSVVTHHAIYKARGNSVYLEEDNCLCLCCDHHRRMHSYFSPREIKLILKTHLPNIERIENVKHQTRKFTVDELEEKIKHYKERIKEIESA